MTYPVHKTDEEWRRQLNPTQYRILRHGGTEPAFKNEYWDNHERGTYQCGGCGADLFRSERKFDSGTGWPSFWEPVRESAIELNKDGSHGMIRIEVRCANCGGHLGHLFNDGPNPTGLRFCMNSGSLKFVPD